MLGKYIFQCAAVRRTSSHEEFTQERDYTPGNDSEVLQELYNQAIFGNGELDTQTDLEEPNLPHYTKEIKCDKNNLNTETNRLAKNIYSYDDNSDYIYGRLSRNLINK